MRTIALTLALGAVALVAISAGTALAAPTGAPNAQWVTATCDHNSGTFRMVVNGNGAFPAAHDVNSTRVFVPVWFGPTTVKAVGKPDQIFPAGIKGSAAPKGHTLITCSWTGVPEEFEGVWYTASGTVGGFFA